MIRKICVHCKQTVTYEREDFIASGLDYDKLKDHTFYEGAGCKECNGQGYHGRTAILELLDLDDNLRDLIIKKASVSQLKEAARAAGTSFLRDSAIEKLLKGETTLAEINRVTFVDKAGGGS